MDDKQNKTKEFQKSMSVLSLGIELTIPIVVFALLGYWVDTEYNSQPTWMVVGLFVGLIVGSYNFWKIIRKLTKNDK